MKNILVLFGGCSPEYEVSLSSAAAVTDGIDRTKYTPVTVGITRDGRWLRYTGGTEDMAVDRWQSPELCCPAAVSPDRGGPGLLTFTADGVEKTRIDAAFPVLHGQNGEDGTVQGLLELAGIPIAGCGCLSSALCMDKDRAHKLAALAGVKVPRSALLRRGQEAEAAGIAERLGLPVFVKPVRAGSSFGVSRVDSPEKLAMAVELALSYDGEALIEEAVPGFEVGCAVMGRDRLITGQVDEIELSGGFFDYREKYNLITSKIHVPARIAPEKAREIKEAAKAIYKALGCSGFARVDMFLTPGGDVVFNEVNTIPGFTSHSRFPGMLKAAGWSFEQVVNMAIQGALEK